MAAGKFYAVALKQPRLNEALTYTMTTARDVVIDKVALIAYEETQILESKEAPSSLKQEQGASASRVVGVLPEAGLAYLISDEKDGWYYVESGDVRGFLKAERVAAAEDLGITLDDVIVLSLAQE